MSGPSFGGAPPPPAYEQPVSKIELRVSCRNLVDMDVLSKSDPFVVLFMQHQGNTTWSEIGRTETIMDNLNPDFVKSFTVDYFFEEQQNIKFEVYDSDDPNSRNLSSHDFIGRVVTTLGSIVGENCGKFQHGIQTASAKDTGYHSNNNFKRGSLGTIIVRAEEISANKDIVTFSLSGKGLDKKDWFGKSDPYLEFQRCNEDNTYTVVHRTEVIKNTLNPIWKVFTIPVQVLCNGDYQRNIKVFCYDWNSSGTSDLIGVFETNLEDLKGYRTGKASSYDIFNLDKHGKRKSKKSGSIHIEECVVTQRLSFFDYITGLFCLGTSIINLDLILAKFSISPPRPLHQAVGQFT